MSREAMQMALEALESDPVSHAGLVNRKQAITALRQALVDDVNTSQERVDETAKDRLDREQIIRMAREAGCKPFRSPEHWDDVQVFATPDVLERFAALVAKHERESCARLCDQMFHDWCNQEFEDEDEAYRNKPDAEDCKKAIRERGNT